jgi:transcriptional regulator with XRE-family HTH domain
MTIGARLSLARRTIGISVDEFSSLSGIPVSTQKKYESGNRVPGGEALQAVAKTGINIHWLLTGEGEMLSADSDQVGGYHDLGKSHTEFQKRIEDIELLLEDEAHFVIPQERMTEKPELYEAKQSLIGIVAHPSASPDVRAKADKILELAYGDDGASARDRSRLGSVGERLKKARRAYEDAVHAVGYQPQPQLEETIKHLLFSNGLTEDGAVLLLDAIQRTLDTPSKETQIRGE